MPIDRTLGVVLAGGQSTRMGRNKALMPWPDGDVSRARPLFEHAAALLSPHCGAVEISIGGSSELAQRCAGSWHTLRDDADAAGPLAGLVAALERGRASGYDLVLVLACDVPLLAPDDLAALVAAVDGGADASLWRTKESDGGVVDHPLVAAYRSTLAPLARAAFGRGERKVTSFLADTLPEGRTPHVERLHADENSALRLVNVNTETDYDRARKRALRDDIGTHDAP